MVFRIFINGYNNLDVLRNSTSINEITKQKLNNKKIKRPFSKRARSFLLYIYSSPPNGGYLSEFSKGFKV